MSTKWKWMGNNLPQKKTREEKRKFENDMFKLTLMVKRMKVKKPVVNESGMVLWGTVKERK